MDALTELRHAVKNALHTLYMALELLEAPPVSIDHTVQDVRVCQQRLAIATENYIRACEQKAGKP